VEIVEAHLRRIESVNPSLNAIVTIAPDAIEQARAAERSLRSGDALGPLHGLPITVKDTIDTAGLRTTSGSKLRAGHIPTQDATVVARLKAAGAIVLGKTNTPEMAIPYETDNPIFGRTNNPHDLNKTCGGSSGGEAAAIAAHLSPAGIGSDLSGSIRVPAHFCGIFGLKPTTGVVPMNGHLPHATGTLSLGACIGPMARTVEDLSLLFASMKEGVSEPAGDLRALRLAFYVDDSVIPVTAETERAVLMAADALAKAGLEVRAEKPPGLAEGPLLWIELFSKPSAEQLREFYRGNEDEAGPLVSKILNRLDRDNSLEGGIASSEQVARAVVWREQLRERLLQWMRTTPLIIAPVGSCPAFEHGARRVDVGGDSFGVFRAFSYSQTFNVYGLPAVSVPVAKSEGGLPIGVQIIGQPHQEETVLAAAKVVSEARA